MVDRNGDPTRDPGAIDDGYLSHFGGYKGQAVMTATEFLGPILTRASAYSETEHGTDLLRHQGVRMIVFRVDLFQSLSGFVRDAAVLSERAGRITPVGVEWKIRSRTNEEI